MANKTVSITMQLTVPDKDANDLDARCDWEHYVMAKVIDILTNAENIDDMFDKLDINMVIGGNK